MKAQIIVPAFNESQIIFKVLTSLPKKLKGISVIETILVNDGSQDDTLKQAKKANVQTVSHAINRGLGAAIKTGLELAKTKSADIAKADLVIGSRFKKLQNVPIDRLILNWFANLATLMMFGVISTDSQSGLRAFSKKALNLIDFKGERMDFSSEILLEAKKHNLIIAEVPIKAIYTPYSRTKGQKNLNSLAVFGRFLVKVFR